MFVAVLVQRSTTLGTPAAGIAATKRQRPSPPMRSPDPSPRRHDISNAHRPLSAPSVAPHMPFRPGGLTLPKSDSPVPKVCGRRGSQAHGTVQIPPSLPLSVTWPFGHFGQLLWRAPCSATPASWSLRPLHALSRNHRSTPGSPNSTVSSSHTVQSRHNNRPSLINGRFHCSGITSARMPFSHHHCISPVASRATVSNLVLSNPYNLSRPGLRFNLLAVVQ